MIHSTLLDWSWHNWTFQPVLGSGAWECCKAFPVNCTNDYSVTCVSSFFFFFLEVKLDKGFPTKASAIIRVLQLACGLYPAAWLIIALYLKLLLLRTAAGAGAVSRKRQARWWRGITRVRNCSCRRSCWRWGAQSDPRTGEYSSYWAVDVAAAAAPGVFKRSRC